MNDIVLTGVFVKISLFQTCFTGHSFFSFCPTVLCRDYSFTSKHHCGKPFISYIIEGLKLFLNTMSANFFALMLIV